MELTQVSRVNSLQMEKLVPGAEAPLVVMAPSFYVHSVARNRLSPPMRDELRSQNAAPIAEIHRNSILLCEKAPAGKAALLIAVAERGTEHVHSLVSDIQTLHNLVIVGRPSVPSRVLTVVVPNSHRHVFIRTLVYRHNTETALFGLFDRCIYPDCALCRLSAVCLTGTVPVAAAFDGIVPSYDAALDTFHVGDAHPHLTIDLSAPRYLYQPLLPREFQDRGILVRAVQTSSRVKHVQIEYVRPI
jgi:hypothetical protein